jgi:hypothetical protein
LERQATEDLLCSPNDGEPLVVIWGVDYDELPHKAISVEGIQP